MNAVVRRRLEMAARARDFLRAHRTEVAPEETALARLEELLQRADTLAAQQRAGVVAARSATLQRAGFRGELQKLLKFVAAVGVVAAKDNPDLPVHFRLPQLGVSHQTFVTAAHGILEKASALKDVLIGRGMATTLLDDLAKDLAEYERTLEATRAGRRDHVGASTDLNAVASEIAEQVRVLDGLVSYRFGTNAELMGAWTSARNVLGPFRSKSEPDAGGGETPQTGAGPVASAA